MDNVNLGHFVPDYTASEPAISGLASLAGSLRQLYFSPISVKLIGIISNTGWRARYAELLSQFKTINSIPILLDPENNFRITLRELRREIVSPFVFEF